jgi:hypothetical protein
VTTLIKIGDTAIQVNDWLAIAIVVLVFALALWVLK